MTAPVESLRALVTGLDERITAATDGPWVLDGPTYHHGAPDEEVELLTHPAGQGPPWKDRCCSVLIAPLSKDAKGHGHANLALAALAPSAAGVLRDMGRALLDEADRAAALAQDFPDAPGPADIAARSVADVARFLTLAAPLARELGLDGT